MKVVNTLCILNAAKREVGWVSAPGDVWTKTLPRLEHVRSVEIDGVAIAFDLNARTRVLTIVTPENPNSRFTAIVRAFHFAIAPTEAAADLAGGPVVYFEPSLASISAFGTELDIVAQSTLAIDSSGTINFFRTEWWVENFDRYFFENQLVELFEEDSSGGRTRIFKGRVETKSWNRGSVQFKVQNLMADLRGSLSLPFLSQLGFEKISESDDDTLVRMIFGRVAGFVPLNVDAKRGGYYLLPGDCTVTQDDDECDIDANALKYLSPGDKVRINAVEMTLAEVPDADTIVFTEPWIGESFTGAIEVAPENPRRWMNRVWKVASHVLRDPTTTTLAGSTVSMIFVQSTRDMFAGDVVRIGTLNARVGKIINEVTIRLATSLPTAPPAGTTVRRMAIQNVKIDGVFLEPHRDYAFDPETAMLTLEETAEWNAGPIREGAETATFSNGSRTVTGVGTSFKSWVKPGFLVRAKGQLAFFEVMSVDSDESMTLRTASTYSSGAIVQYKTDCFWDESTITLETLGRTDDGTPGGVLLQTPGAIVRTLITDAGAAEDDIGAFEESSTQLALAVPELSTDKKLPTFRELINRVNVSTFGMVFQTSEFRFGFRFLEPRADVDRLRLSETDVLEVAYSSTNKEMALSTVVTYAHRELHEEIGAEYRASVTAESEHAKHILKTLKTRTINSVLVNQDDAAVLAMRTAFFHDRAMGELAIRAKGIQAPSIGDIIEVDHSKIPRRLGGESQRLLVLVQGVAKGLDGEISISCVDLSGGFSRACFVDTSGPDYLDSNADRRIATGFISDSNDLVNDDEESLERFLIW